MRTVGSVRFPAEFVVLQERRGGSWFRCIAGLRKPRRVEGKRGGSLQVGPAGRLGMICHLSMLGKRWRFFPKNSAHWSAWLERHAAPAMHACMYVLFTLAAHACIRMPHLLTVTH
eukprot:6209633-Pleurochrysis_carterae.AAC.4